MSHFFDWNRSFDLFKTWVYNRQQCFWLIFFKKGLFSFTREQRVLYHITTTIYLHKNMRTIQFRKWRNRGGSRILLRPSPPSVSGQLDRKQREIAKKNIITGVYIVHFDHDWHALCFWRIVNTLAFIYSGIGNLSINAFESKQKQKSKLGLHRILNWPDIIFAGYPISGRKSGWIANIVLTQFKINFYFFTHYIKWV